MIGLVFTWNGRKTHIKDVIHYLAAVTLCLKYLLYLLSENMKGNMMEHWWSIDKGREESFSDLAIGIYQVFWPCFSHSYLCNACLFLA